MQGSHFRRVALPADSPAAGLLGQGSVLTVTSHPIRTSPVLRGKWILNNILGTPPPDPPADVPALARTAHPGEVQTMRERMAAHRSNPVCATCHNMIDPAGFALENFDAIGRWRDGRRLVQSDRRGRRVARRHQVQRRGRVAGGAGAPAGALHQHGDREVADLRARPRPRVLRHDRGAAHRRGRGRATTIGSRSLILEIVKQLSVHDAADRRSPSRPPPRRHALKPLRLAQRPCLDEERLHGHHARWRCHGGPSCAGMGATIALPFLDSMVPALSAPPATTRRCALGFFYVPNGMYLPNFHPTAGRRDFEFTPVLKPLEPFRRPAHRRQRPEQHRRRSVANEGGGVHTRAHAGWLNGVLPKRTEGADITAGKTIDQYAADKLGADTPLRSLELTTESSFHGRQLRERLQLRVSELDVMAHAQHAAAPRARSARRVPADVRRWRQRRPRAWRRCGRTAASSIR